MQERDDRKISAQGINVKVGSLFSGMLGLDLAVERAASAAALSWACEIEPLPRRLIRARRPAARLYGDVRGLRPLPPCDIVTGGFPCTDVSVAGRQAGLAGEKSGLWREMHAVIQRVRPRRVFVENVRNLRTLGLREVLADLARIGYAAEWQTVQALAAGAYHKRSRIFIVAYPDEAGAPLLLGEGLRDDYAAAFAQNRASIWRAFPCSPVIRSGDLPTDVRNARLTATGNAVCPQQAEPIARAMLGAGEAWGAQVRHEQPEMPFAGAMRGGSIYVRPVAVPESLAMAWHVAWCEANPDAARAVLPAGRNTYPTPSASAYGSSQNGVNGVGGENERPSAGTPSLSPMARQGAFPVWPTPCTTDAASAARHTTDADGAMHAGTTLTDAARLWATPAAANWRSGSVSDGCFDGNSRPLQEQVLRLYPTPTGSMLTPGDMTQAMTAGGSPGRPSYAEAAAMTPAGRFLAPSWTAWLMGFPAGWFDGTSDHDAQIGMFA